MVKISAGQSKDAWIYVSEVEIWSNADALPPELRSPSGRHSHRSTLVHVGGESNV